MLVLRTPCEHGQMQRHIWEPRNYTSNPLILVDSDWCPGGVETVLDPTTVVVLPRDRVALHPKTATVYVADVLHALQGDEHDRRPVPVLR